MSALRLITAVYAIALCHLLVASVKINKQKQDRLLAIFLPNGHDYLGISYTEARSILGYRDETVDSLLVSTLLKSRGIGILQKHGVFSQFDDRSMDEAERTFDLLVAAPNYDNFIQRAGVVKEHVNRQLFLFAVEKAVLYRHDTHDVQTPPLWQVSARSFFTDDAITAAIQNTKSLKTSSEIPISRSAIPEDAESELSWFREDLGLNTMHYVHSIMVRSDDADVELKAMDSYSNALYGSLMNRYNVERQDAEMDEVQPLDLDHIITEGYDSHLATPSGDAMFSARPSGIKPGDVTRNGKRYTLSVLKNIKLKVTEAITRGYMIENDGTKTVTTPLKLFRAIIGFYGNEKLEHVYGDGIHIYEHLISSVTSPGEGNGQSLGVMGVVETSMRDPLFFRLHANKYLLDVYYENLQPYSKAEFELQKVEINDVELVSTNPDEKDASLPNVLTTYMETVEVDIQYDPSVADDRAEADGAPILVGVERLNHDGFMYKMIVSNRNVVPVSATARIFMAPSIDRRTGKPFKSLIEQREQFFEMDKFIINLNPGVNVIERQDEESTLASPDKLSVEDLKTEGIVGRRNAGCFWPQNLLLPRGNAQGVKFDVFVILMDQSRDHEKASDARSEPKSNPCGIMSDNDKHIDGYPFERKLSQEMAAYLVGTARNAFVAQVKIQHDGKRRRY